MPSAPTPMSPHARRAAGSRNTRESIRTKRRSNWFAVGDMALDKFINFKTGCCAAQVPYVFDSNENFLGQMAGGLGPTSSKQPPIQTNALGNFQPSPDFTHLAFSSQANFDTEGNGVTSAPGSAYDYDVADETTEIISKRRRTALTSPRTRSSTDSNEVINFPGPEPFGTGCRRKCIPSVSIDGSHILMGTKHCNGCTEEHLYMRVNDAITYDIAGRGAGQLLRDDLGRQPRSSSPPISS